MLHGTTAGDAVGTAVVPLTNGNVVVASPLWGSADVGAVTWVNGETGLGGPVAPSNSLTGTMAFDYVGSSRSGLTVTPRTASVTPLANGNYVVASPDWDNGSMLNAGAITWGDGDTGVAGQVSTANSLYGSLSFLFAAVDDSRIGSGGVTATNGNYVVASPSFSFVEQTAMLPILRLSVGAATWADGSVPTVGAVTALQQRLRNGDRRRGVERGSHALANGHYVVGSPGWSGLVAGGGAATWGNGATGSTGAVATGNSLYGTTASVGVGGLFDVAALSNGNYVVTTSGWPNGAASNAGAATFVNGGGPHSAGVSAANSLVGTQAGDGVGLGALALTNGNFVVAAPLWDKPGAPNAGAVTWVDGSAGRVGVISAATSLTGADAEDNIGAMFGALSNGNYVIASQLFGTDDGGAVTWADGSTVTVGTVGPSNSIIGGAGDNIGAGDRCALGRELRVHVAVVGWWPRCRHVGRRRGVDSRYGHRDEQRRRGCPRRQRRRRAVRRRPRSTSPRRGRVSGAQSSVGRPRRGARGRSGDLGAERRLIGRGRPGQQRGRDPCGPHVGNPLPAEDLINHQVVVPIPAENRVVLVSTHRQLRPLTPARLLETRPGMEPGTVDDLFEGGGTLGAGGTLQLEVAGRGGVSPFAVAAVLNVTVTEPVAPGFVTVFPCGQPRPIASNLNFAAGQTIPNAVIAELGDDGRVCLYSLVTTHLIIDVNAYYPPLSGYTPANPARIMETRPTEPLTVDGLSHGAGLLPSGTTTELQVGGRAGTPADATIATLNVTVTGPTDPGYVTLFPCGSPRPNASNLNHGRGETIPNLVVTKLGAGGKVCIFNLTATHLVVDLNGWHTPLEHAARDQPGAPARNPRRPGTHRRRPVHRHRADRRRIDPCAPDRRARRHPDRCHHRQPEHHGHPTRRPRLRHRVLVRRRAPQRVQPQLHHRPNHPQCRHHRPRRRRHRVPVHTHHHPPHRRRQRLRLTRESQRPTFSLLSGSRTARRSWMRCRRTLSVRDGSAIVGPIPARPSA